MKVRKAAHALGFRFRLRQKNLLGCTNLVFSRLKKVIFVHGCYWHRHSGCKYAYTPKTNIEFWSKKFEENIERDRLAVEALKTLGWEVLIIWECETRDIPSLNRTLSNFLGSESTAR